MIVCVGSDLLFDMNYRYLHTNELTISMCIKQII